MRKKITDKQINQMKRYRQKGMTYKAVAEKVGVSVSSVQYHTKDVIATKKPKKKLAKKVGVKRVTTTTTEAYYDDSPKVVNKIHRRGNELHNVDVHNVNADKLMDENGVPLIHTDKVETTNAVLWMMLAACAAILTLGLANL